MNSSTESVPKQYFLDTNFLISVLDPRDIHHNRAVKILGILPSTDSRNVFLSDTVFNETLTVLARRGLNQKNPHNFSEWSEKFRLILPEYPILCLYDTLPKGYKKIIDLMTKFEGRLSFHDCLIALFLKEVQNVRLVSFDEEFHKVGWL